MVDHKHWVRYSARRQNKLIIFPSFLRISQDHSEQDIQRLACQDPGTCLYCVISMIWPQSYSTLDLHGLNFRILIHEVLIIMGTSQGHERIPWDGVCVWKFCLNSGEIVWVIKTPLLSMNSPLGDSFCHFCSSHTVWGGFNHSVVPMRELRVLGIRSAAPPWSVPQLHARVLKQRHLHAILAAIPPGHLSLYLPS